MNQARQSFPHEEQIRTVTQRILQPLVRLLISKGYTVQWLAAEIKDAYVDVAVRELGGDEAKGISNSRINLMTGIQRPEVKRIRSAIDSKSITVIHPVARLISVWHGETGDKSDTVPPLARTPSENSKTPSFFELADRATNKNVAPATFLNECIQKGIVRHDPDTDLVHLLESAFVPTKAFGEQLNYLAENEGDHIEAGVENILGRTPKFFDRSVLYKGFSEEDVAALEEFSREVAMEALLKVNKEARRRAKSNRRGGYRFNFGIFNFLRNDAPPSPVNETGKD